MELLQKILYATVIVTCTIISGAVLYIMSGQIMAMNS
jgi:hypothetical protein